LPLPAHVGIVRAMPTNFETAFAAVKKLVSDFHGSESEYLDPAYKEESARNDFINKFFFALGWDVFHDQQKKPSQQEVKLERNVTVGLSQRFADYAFYVAPHFRKTDVRFFGEAKKPAGELITPDHCHQTIRYGWNAENSPLAVLTSFKQLAVLDCRSRPNKKTATRKVVRHYNYTDYADSTKFREIFDLLSRDAVAGGSLQTWAGLAPTLRGELPPDETFLQELDTYRGNLARAFKNRNPDLTGETLTEITQRTLDRLVFLRFLEDKGIETKENVASFAQSLTAWPDFIKASKRLNGIYNGIVFRPHRFDEPDFQVDQKDFADVCQWLSGPDSPYLFNIISIHTLGSIYERFLGKVIVTTDKRARVEEKPEVRKAGGVHYTPEYISRYIVANTVGKLIAGKTPAQIAEMTFADISSGSGSFLLAVFDVLLEYHRDWYNANPDKAKKAGCVPDGEGAWRLSLQQRREILLHNIYGVDIDRQAVEVCQLSLYLKLLEDETTATASAYQMEFHETLLPSLKDNIVCGNSLIGTDFSLDIEERKQVKAMDFKERFPHIFGNKPGMVREVGEEYGVARSIGREGGRRVYPSLPIETRGFDAIVGNPPYIRIQMLQETTPQAVTYFGEHYESAGKGNYDIYVVFVERALSLLNPEGQLGYILPHKFFNAQYGAPLRGVLARGKTVSNVVHFSDQQVFDGATTYTCLLFLSKAGSERCQFVKVSDLEAWRANGTGDEGKVSAANITNAEWNFVAGKSAGLFEKLNKSLVKLKDVADLFVGLQTDADDCYILEEVKRSKGRVLCESRATGRQHWFEDEHLKPFLKGSLNIRRYLLSDATKRLIFPYETKDGKSVLIEPKDYKLRFPLTWEYLEENRQLLAARNKGQMGRDWYGYVYKKNHTRFGNPKILVPSIATGSCFAADFEGRYFFVGSGGGGGGGYGIVLNSDAPLSSHCLLGLLNSRVLESILKLITTSFRGGYIALNRQYIEQLPIAIPDKARHDRMVALVDQMLAVKKKLAAAQSDADKDFYGTTCATLDSEIDALVYKLYGLTKEEIKIVEGADK